MRAASVDLSRSNCGHVSLNSKIVQSVRQRPKCIAMQSYSFRFLLSNSNFTYFSHSFIGRRCRSLRACVSWKRYSVRPTIRRSKQIKKLIPSELNLVFGYNFWSFGFISIFVPFSSRADSKFAKHKLIIIIVLGCLVLIICIVLF